MAMQDVADHLMGHPIKKKLLLIGASLKRKAILRYVMGVVFYGSLAGAVGVFAVYPFLRGWLGARWLGLLAFGSLCLFAAVAYIWAAFRVRPTLFGTAIFLDMELGLEERVATAVEYLDPARRASREIELTNLAIEDAAARIGGLSPSDIPAMARRTVAERYWKQGIAVLFAASIALLFIPVQGPAQPAPGSHPSGMPFLSEPEARPPIGDRIASYLRELLQPKSPPSDTGDSNKKRGTSSAPGSGKGEIPRAGGAPDKEERALLDEVRDMASLLGEGNLSPEELSRLGETLKKLGAAAGPGNIFSEALDALTSGDEDAARKILEPFLDSEKAPPGAGGGNGSRGDDVEREGGSGSFGSQKAVPRGEGDASGPAGEGDGQSSPQEGSGSADSPGGGPQGNETGEPGKAAPAPGRTPGGRPLGEPAPRLGTSGPLVRLDGQVKEGQGDSREITVFAPFSSKGLDVSTSPRSIASSGAAGEAPMSVERIPLEYREIVRSYFDIKE